jgi:hypothetical protein
MTMAAVALVCLAAVVLVAGWRARAELRGGDAARVRDLDPDSITRWHRAMRALRHVTRNAPPAATGGATSCSDVVHGSQPIDNPPSLR